MVRKPRDPAWLPADYVVADIEAIKALSKGEADAGQQGRALRWIIETAAGLYEEHFRSDADGGTRDTDYALGRAYVGRQIVKLINMPPKVVAAIRSKDG